MGYGGAGPIPPKERVPLAVKSAPEATIVASVAPPAPGSAPAPRGVVDTLKGLGDDQRPRSLSPPPESVAAQFKAAGVDVKIGKPFLSKLRGWIVPLLVSAVLSLVGTVSGAVVGYYEGLKRAGWRVSAVEGELAELRAVHDTKLKNLSAGLAREGVLTNDHEERLNDLKPRVELVERRITDISKTKAIIVKPSP